MIVDENDCGINTVELFVGSERMNGSFRHTEHIYPPYLFSAS